MWNKKSDKKMNVIAAVSWSGYEYVMVSEFNTTGSIFCIFLKNLIQHLKLKYEEYFAKIILTCDGARYHQIKNIDNLLINEEMMMVTTIPYTPEFSFIELFINDVKNKFRKLLRKQRQNSCLIFINHLDQNY